MKKFENIIKKHTKNKRIDKDYQDFALKKLEELQEYVRRKSNPNHISALFVFTKFKQYIFLEKYFSIELHETDNEIAYSVYEYLKDMKKVNDKSITKFYEYLINENGIERNRVLTMVDDIPAIKAIFREC